MTNGIFRVCDRVMRKSPFNTCFSRAMPPILRSLKRSTNLANRLFRKPCLGLCKTQDTTSASCSIFRPRSSCHIGVRRLKLNLGRNASCSICAAGDTSRHFDLDNPIQSHDSIPSFVAQLPHSDIVIILNTEDYGKGKLSPWIKAERHAALLNALEGTCDILIFRCDSSPLADDWMEAFPAIDVNLYREDLSLFDPMFPVIQVIDTERQSQIDELLASIKLRLAPQTATKVIAELDRFPEVLGLPRAQEIRAVLKSICGLSDEDRPWLDAFNYRNSGRRLRFAHVMAAKGNLPLAITCLHRFFVVRIGTGLSAIISSASYLRSRDVITKPATTFAWRTYRQCAPDRKPNAAIS